MRRNLLAVGGVALVLGVLGCGSSSPSHPLTKAAFVKRASAVCAGVQQRFSHSRARAMARMLAFQEAKLEGLQALTPPAQLQDRFAAYTRDLSAFRDLLRQYRTSVDAGRPLRGLGARAGVLFRQQQQLAVGLGLSNCE